MTGRRVVITGLGVISALGKDRHGFWAGITEGRSGIAPMEDVDLASYSFQNGAQVRGYDPVAMLPSKDDRALDLNAQFALLAAREAMQDAGLELTEELRDRAGAATGCACGGKRTEDEQYYKIYAEGKRRGHPLVVPKIMGNSGVSRISMEFGLRGPVINLSTACSSANHAMGQAFWTIRNDVADVALVGGNEAIFSHGHLKAWDALRVVSPDTCRPFSRDRLGMVLGEGAAILVLEELSLARARGAEIYAEICGFGMTADAHHLTMPSVDGPARAMAAALRDGGIDPAEVTYVNAHGTGTPANDPNETRAIHRVFGDHARRLAVSSTKSSHGHALGASGALEAAATVLAIRYGVLPPTVNFTAADPECDLDYVPNEARDGAIDAALSSSYAFGGLNAVLAFKRFR